MIDGITGPESAWIDHSKKGNAFITLPLSAWICLAAAVSTLWPIEDAVCETGISSQETGQVSGIDKANSGWNMLEWQQPPVDLSFLNKNEKPAGRRGFVKVKGESLVFADGATARFWGANITAYALFGTPSDNVKKQARRLSALGFNLVRIHHHDSPWVSPNIFGKNAASTRVLDPASLDKLDWWIKCLKEEGIYIWLDLHVGREFTAADRIDGFEEISQEAGAIGLKGYNYVNPSMRHAMKEFNAAYLNHVNNYTGVKYKDEPAIMAMLITNENDLTNHFGNLLMPDKGVPWHNHNFMELAKAFAQKNHLPQDKTWRAWEAGPSKLFLNDLEHEFDADMISHLHGIGVKVPVATTSIWGGNTVSSIPALTTGDIIDAHAYGGPHELEKNPLYESSMINWLSMAQVIGKPMSVSEWNVLPFPVPDRHIAPLLLASAARHQGWDAVSLYAYAQYPPEGSGRASSWQAFNDPSLVATLPAAALLYRQGHVRESAITYALAPDREQLFFQPNSSYNSVAARTSSELGKLALVMPAIAELPWLEKGEIPQGSKVVRDLNQRMAGIASNDVTSGTGELRRNWSKGIYTIETANTQAVLGRVGGERIRLSHVQFDIGTRSASIAVQSMDGAPVNQSSRLMISLGTQAFPGDKGSSYRVEPVLGRLTISARKGLKLRCGAADKNSISIPPAYHNGKYEISLDGACHGPWMFME